jgi:hypothetical protein
MPRSVLRGSNWVYPSFVFQKKFAGKRFVSVALSAITSGGIIDKPPRSDEPTMETSCNAVRNPFEIP